MRARVRLTAKHVAAGARDLERLAAVVAPMRETVSGEGVTPARPTARLAWVRVRVRVRG